MPRKPLILALALLDVGYRRFVRRRLRELIGF
jgi:hypothetical protein